MAERPLPERLAVESARYMGTLERLGAKLADSIEVDVVEGAETPSRDWCRAFGRYQGGIHQLLAEERERTKLRLLVDGKGGHRALSDEEYADELRSLGLEAVRALPAEELAAEVARRGLSVTHVDDDRDDET